MKTDDIRKMGLAYLQVQEAKTNKHGHDAVGHEDGDIDNDGDKDKSDSYLHNRRKAISANVKKEEVEVDEALVGNQHKIDANKNGKVDAHDFHLLRKGKKVQKEEVEELDELSSKTLGNYSAAASQPKNQGSKQDKRIAGQHMADQKVRKKYGYSSDAKVAAESTEWPVFNRILEKSDKFTVNYKVSGVGDDPHQIDMKFADPDHVKGATKPEKAGETLSASDKKFIDMHGGLDGGNDSGIHGHKAAAHTAKAAVAGVKTSPGNPGDSKIGDKTMPKPKG
jgi:hypothetical protein